MRPHKKVIDWILKIVYNTHRIKYADYAGCSKFAIGLFRKGEDLLQMRRKRLEALYSAPSCFLFFNHIYSICSAN